MIRLVLSDLRDHAPTWAGALLVAVGCGFIGGWAASFQRTALFYGGTLHWYLHNAVTVLLLFSIPVALVVLTSASNLTVSVQRRSYALWQLANVWPGFVRNVVLAQLAVVAVPVLARGLTTRLPVVGVSPRECPAAVHSRRAERQPLGRRFSKQDVVFGDDRIVPPLILLSQAEKRAGTC